MYSAMGIFDQFISARLLDRYPQLYQLGQRGIFFKKHSFPENAFWKEYCNRSDITPNYPSMSNSPRIESCTASFQNAFSGEVIYESWTLSFYNVLFTVLPPFAMGLRDNVKDERVEESIQNPSPKAVLLEEDASLAQLVQLWGYLRILDALLL
jgi:hypothetical protein